MTDNVLRLRIIFDDVKGAASALDKYGDEAQRAERESSKLEGSSKRLSSGMRELKQAIAALGLGLLIRESFQLVSSYQTLENKLRLVTSGMDELGRVQEKLTGISRRSFQSYSATADLYSRLARSTEDLGLSQNRLLQVTETINKAVALSGASAQTAAASLFQLGQGLGAGALRGEELNSVLEGTPELARAIAEGLGLGIGELREFAAEGKLTAEQVIGALTKQAEEVDAAFSRLNPTIEQIGGVLQDAFNQGFVSESVDDMRELAAVLNNPEIIQDIETIGKAFGQLFGWLLEQLPKVIKEVSDLFDRVGEFSERYGIFEVQVDVKDPNSIVDRLEQLLKQLQMAETQQGIAFSNDNVANALRIGTDAIAPKQAEAKSLLRALGIDETFLDQSYDDMFEALGTWRDNLGKASDASSDLEEALSSASEGVSKFESKLQEAQIAIQNQRVIDAGLQGARNLVDGLGPEDTLSEFLQDFQDIVDIIKLDVGALGGVERGQAEKLLKDLAKLEKEGIDKIVQSNEEISVAIRALEEVEFIASLGADVFNDLTDALDDFREGTSEAIARGIAKVGVSLGDALKSLGGLTGSGALGAIGQTLGTVGQVASLVAGAIGFFKSLFGKPSDNPTGGGIDLSTGLVSNLFAKNNNQENINARDALIGATLELTDALKSLTGGNFGNSQLSIQVGNRNGTRIISSLGGDVTTPVGDETAAINEVFRQLTVALQGGQKSLVDYVKAAQAATRAPEDIIEGLEKLKAIFDLTLEPLSNVEQQLKTLDDTINPVVEDLKALGQSIAGVQSVAAEAARQIGKNFIEGIQDDIDTFQNATLAQFKRLLKAQDQIIKDATTLFERGAITASEFDLVQVRNSLERKSFFDNLSPEDLESLGDYLGLIENSGGSIAVVLTLLQDAFSDFVDNVAETRQKLQDEADELKRAAERIFSTRDRIDLRFPSKSGGDLLADLRGQLGGLREQAFAGDATAFEKIPELADRFVNLARDIFGSTADFARERDFALQVLDQTGGLAQSRSDKLLTEIEALNSQVDVLNDIREAIESPDPAIDFIKAQLDQNFITNDLLRDLLQQYIVLSQTAQASSLTPTQVQAAATAALGVGGTVGATPVSVDFSDVVVNLNQVRTAISTGNTGTADILNRILSELRTQRIQAAVTG